MNTEVFDLGKIGITLGGEYDNKVIYEKLTIVLYKGKSYISTKTTQGVSPEQDMIVWQLVAEAKDAYHMLVDAGKTTLSEEEFLEQLVDATKGRFIVQGNITNAADEEDLTVEHSDLLGIDTLKLANRDNTNGMGYVILRKNKSFAEQVTKENTIYEIRYDFDISNATIPNNIRFKFNGGSLINNNIKINSNIVSSDTIGMIPSNMAYASSNYEILVSFINKGFTIDINNIYYIGKSSTSETYINNDINLFGNGTIIFTAYMYDIGNGEFIIKGNNININISGLTFDTTNTKTPKNNSRVFVIDNSIESFMLGDVIFDNCTFLGVRILTYAAKDVDQITNKEGFNSITFTNNKSFEITNYLINIVDCICEYINISNNYFEKIYSSLFNFSTTNEYTSYARNIGHLQNIIIQGNYLDNKDYISEASNYYYSFAVIEGENVICVNNIFKNLRSIANDALYTVYMSCKKVVYSNNYVENCYNIKSNLNECFKAKYGKDLKEFTNNTIIITKESIEELKDRFPEVADLELTIHLFNYQGRYIENCLIQNNHINVYCKFTFGGSQIFAYNYIFNNNTIKALTNDIQALIYLKTSENDINDIGNIQITNNNIEIKNPNLQNHISFLKGNNNAWKVHNVLFENNILYGFFNLGDYDHYYGDSDGTTLISVNNRITNNLMYQHFRYNGGYIRDTILTKDMYIMIYSNNNNSKLDLELKSNKSNILRFNLLNVSENIKYKLDYIFEYITISYIIIINKDSNQLTIIEPNGSENIHTIDDTFEYTIATNDISQRIKLEDKLLEIFINRTDNCIIKVNKYNINRGITNYIKELYKGTNNPTLPSIYKGYTYFNTNLNKTLYWNGSKWVDENNISIDALKFGTFEQKPTIAAHNIPIGYKYFCTDKQSIEGGINGIEIIHKGNNIWCDALGREIS